tara:strand:- start:533 stop:709 length:177 start_codon:yes stop_codon:yes gene_type:complete
VDKKISKEDQKSIELAMKRSIMKDNPKTFLLGKVWKELFPDEEKYQNFNDNLVYGVEI